jgi:REP element-mobilizing transposase RayT
LDLGDMKKASVKQMSLPGFGRKPKAGAHGGEFARGKRKTRRPFDPKQALHVVLRSSRAKGDLSMLHPRHCKHIFALLERLKKRWNVSVYRYANVGNHLHLLIRARSRADWQGFIREFSGGIAMIVTGAKKGNALKRAEVIDVPESAQRAFWDHLVFTRIVAFGRDFKGVAQYVSTNLWEGLGIPVRKFLSEGYRILEMSHEGAVLVPISVSEEFIGALKPN